jgi:hypothetical protein
LPITKDEKWHEVKSILFKYTPLVSRCELLVEQPIT